MKAVYGGRHQPGSRAAVLGFRVARWISVTAANLHGAATGLGGPTGLRFDNYRAFIVGDPLCGTSAPGYPRAVSALNATKLMDSVCAGNVILEA